MQRDNKSVSGKELGNGVSRTSPPGHPQVRPTLQMQWPNCNVGVRRLEGRSRTPWWGISTWWYITLPGAASHRCLLARPVRVGRSLLRGALVKGGAGLGAPGSATVGACISIHREKKVFSRKDWERAVERRAGEQSCPFPWQHLPARQWGFALGKLACSGYNHRRGLVEVLSEQRKSRSSQDFSCPPVKIQSILVLSASVRHRAPWREEQSTEDPVPRIRNDAFPRGSESAFCALSRNTGVTSTRN